jgi:hypothetical protein
MTQIALQIDSSSMAWAEALAASLPVSVKHAGEAGDLILVHDRPDWPERLLTAMDRGYRRFLLIDPVIPSESALDPVITQARNCRAGIVISETHADNPAVLPFGESLSGPFSVVTVTGIGTDELANLALQQLRLARRIGLDQFAVIHAVAATNSLVATLSAVFGGEDLLLRLSIARSDCEPGHHRLMAHGLSESACVEIASAPTAQPARAFRVTTDGALDLPTFYESAHRAALRAIAGDFGAAAARGDLGEWKRDADLAVSLVHEGSGRSEMPAL